MPYQDFTEEKIRVIQPSPTATAEAKIRLNRPLNFERMFKLGATNSPRGAVLKKYRTSSLFHEHSTISLPQTHVEFKRKVQNSISVIYLPFLISNLYDIFASAEHNRRYFEERW